LRAPSICAVGLCCLLLGGCAGTAVEGPQSYIVRPQDTLYSIAWRHDLDYRDLARWNNIGADFRITVGQVLLLGPGRTPRPAYVPPPAPKPAATPKPVARPKPATPVPVTAPPAAVVSKWVWPTDRVGEPRPVPGGGILLSGRLGQDVRAANAGHVVYTGSGLRGYGNLIIIKHADNLLSAYAHNREILVQEGQEVTMGQVIAHMGEGGPQSPVLYFEIRQNGKPIDPLPFLPALK
jgi:lipoprotein NlpD